MKEAEITLAEEAAAYARACLELHPYGEAEVLDLGTAKAVFSGLHSPIHGVYALGLDSEVDPKDIEEIEAFYSRKERTSAFWLTPFTDASLLALLKNYRPTKKEKVYAIPFSQAKSPEHLPPDLEQWPLLYTQQRTGATQPDFLALAKLHQKNTRFYLQDGAAAYTFFHQGVALLQGATSAFPMQSAEAKKFSCTTCITTESVGDFLYERTLYEPV